MPNNVKVIRNWLKQAGVVIRPKPLVYPRAEILSKLKSGVSRNDLAEKYGCSLKFLSQLANGKISPRKTTKKKPVKKTAKKKPKKTAKKKPKKTAKKTAKKK